MTDIENEDKRIVREKLIDINTTKAETRIIATKNIVANFMKNKLHMSEADRKSVKIENIFPGSDEDTEILYIKCKTQDDISKITSHARNLNRCIDENKPTLVTHIPAPLFERYQAAEKIMWRIRTTETGKWQTNIRIGRRDLQVRYRLKTDKTDWKNIPIVKIPDNFPKPKYELMKVQPNRNKQPNDQPTIENEDNNKHRKQNNTDNETDMTGTISGDLQSASQKRKASPCMEGQNKQLQPINTQNRWEQLANQDLIENTSNEHHVNLINQYKQITRTNQLEGFNTPTNTSYTIKPISTMTDRTQHE